MSERDAARRAAEVLEGVEEQIEREYSQWVHDHSGAFSEQFTSGTANGLGKALDVIRRRKERLIEELEQGEPGAEGGVRR